MAWMLKTKKSAGVPVSASVHRGIQKANAARDSGHWLAAANFYAAVLAEDSGLPHIWIQLGHAEKEAGRYNKAEAAYRRAADLSPASGEPMLHLGHLYKVMGSPTRAVRCYLAASELEPDNADAAAEFTRLIAQLVEVKPEDIAAMLKTSLRGDDAAEPSLEKAVGEARFSLEAVTGQLAGAKIEDLEVLRSAAAILGAIERRVEQDGEQPRQGTALIFDVSDLMGYYIRSRLPTGIQRVQIEAINSALISRDRPVKICCFIDGRDNWLEVPVDQFRTVTRLSVQSGERNDSAWTSALNRLQLTLALADPFEFPEGGCLVNLGTSWWLRNYFLFVRHAKAKHKIRYIPFVHDFIPIIAPEHCVKELTQDFISWAVGVFDHADQFLVNSEATKRDLIKVADTLGHRVDPDTVTVIRLDADFRKPDTKRLPLSYLAKWRLDEGAFVLFVSTIESRKGHGVAMDAWLELIRKHGARNVPRLVCVGTRGWLNDAVYQRLDQNEELAGRVTMLSYLSDEELALLYRSCQFTIYPSFYEGWGLPITEALSYGKAVVAADSSSLPEAGGDFAVLVETGSFLALANAVEKMSFDADYRGAMEAKIAADFRPRSWQEVAQQIDAEIAILADQGAGPKVGRVPCAVLGAYHQLTRNSETRVWPGFGSGEIFRTGLGWLWPDSWGCRTKPQGGGLAIGLPEGRGALRVYLLLKGLSDQDCPWRLRVKGVPTLTGILRADEEKWISFDYPMLADGGALRMNLRGDNSEKIRMNTGGSEKEYRASLGVRGFFICEADDLVSRAKFLEAAALGNVTDLDAYREHAEPITVADDEAWDSD